MRTILFLTICLVMTVNVSAQYKIPYENLGIVFREGKMISPPADGMVSVSDSLDNYYMGKFIPWLDEDACKKEIEDWTCECVRSCFSESIIQLAQKWKQTAVLKDDSPIIVSVWFNKKGEITWLRLLFKETLYEMLNWKQINELFDKIKNQDVPFTHLFEFPETETEKESLYFQVSFSFTIDKELLSALDTKNQDKQNNGGNTNL